MTTGFCPAIFSISDNRIFENFFIAHRLPDTHIEGDLGNAGNSIALLSPSSSLSLGAISSRYLSFKRCHYYATSASLRSRRQSARRWTCKLELSSVSQLDNRHDRLAGQRLKIATLEPESRSLSLHATRTPALGIRLGVLLDHVDTGHNQLVSEHSTALCLAYPCPYPQDDHFVVALNFAIALHPTA